MALLAMSAAPLTAQPAPARACSPLVIEALQVLDQTCGWAGANQACYGFSTLQPTYSAPDFVGNFEAPAAIVDLMQLSALRGAAYNPVSDEWGIAVLRLRANIPGLLPGQLATMVLLGDVSVTNTSADTAAPMQSFLLSTGSTAPECDELPAPSLTIQSPRHLQATFSVNGVDFSMGSAVNLRLTETSLRLTTLDGRATVGGHVVPLGFSVAADVDASGAVLMDTFSEPEVIAFADLLGYRTLAALPDTILSDDFYVPTPEELALLSAVDFDWLTYLDPYVMRDVLILLGLQGVTPEEVVDLSLDDFAAFAGDLLGDSFPDLLAQLADTIAADGAIIYDLEAQFGTADDDDFFTYTDDDLAAFYGAFFTDYLSEAFGAIAVLPKPRYEMRLQFLQLGLGGNRGFLVDHAFIVNLIVDHRRLGIQSHLQQFQGTFAFCAPAGRVLGRDRPLVAHT